MPDFGIEGDHGAIAVKADHTAAALTARYTNQTIGVATGIPLSAAKAPALLECQAADGQACEIKLSACND